MTIDKFMAFKLTRSSVLTLVETLYVAFVFMKLWNWFLVPLGIVPIGFFHSVGLLFLLGISGFFTFMMPKEVETAWLSSVIQIVFTTVALIGGWLSHLVMS